MVKSSRSHTVWFQDPLTPLNSIEDSKELLFLWVICINIILTILVFTEKF